MLADADVDTVIEGELEWSRKLDTQSGHACCTVACTTSSDREDDNIASS